MLFSYLENITLFLLAILFFIFPLFVTPATIDPYVLPKQAILAAVSLLSLVLFAIKNIVDGSIKIRRTPFDLPIILFTAAVFLSSLFSVHRMDSIISFVPILFAVIIYFMIVNSVKDQRKILFLIVAFIFGGALLSLASILSFLKIYFLPFPFSQNPNFTPLGSLLDQALYQALVLPFAIFLARPVFSSRTPKTIFLSFISIIIAISLFITVYKLFNPQAGAQKTFILPFGTGFQTAFAAISQDTTRTWQGFFLGSGFGTYATDFTRFKQATVNENQELWALTFFRSSSFVLELLATTGILGISSFLFLLIRVIRELRPKTVNAATIPIVSVFIASFILPFSFTIQAALILILALFAVFQGAKNLEKDRFFDVELHLVALRKGLINLATSHQTNKSKVLPMVFSLIILVVIGFVGYHSFRYVTSDITFQKSLVVAATNGQETYRKQTEAISTFPYRDGYYRIYSQTNFALANSLASQTPQGSSPSATTQQTILTLIQQSINSARTATTISPLTSLNWQNLSSIYRGLIGFGQNAENFAIATQQRALLLDPNNPQQYIILGGIYYQLGRWDHAQSQFQIARNLKPDFANAYYNLGHTLRQKNDINSALEQFKIVKRLVANNPDSLKQITEEIKALSSIKEKATAILGTGSKTDTTQKEDLSINQPSTVLPPREPPVKIPPPPTKTEPSQ